MNTNAPHGGRSVDLKSYTYNKEDNGLTIFRYTTWESYFLNVTQKENSSIQDFNNRLAPSLLPGFDHAAQNTDYSQYQI